MEQPNMSDRDLVERAAMALEHLGDIDLAKQLVERYTSLENGLITSNTLLVKVLKQVEAIPALVKPYFDNNPVELAMLKLEDYCKAPYKTGVTQ